MRNTLLVLLVMLTLLPTWLFAADDDANSADNQVEPKGLTSKQKIANEKQQLSQIIDQAKQMNLKSLQQKNAAETAQQSSVSLSGDASSSGDQDTTGDPAPTPTQEQAFSNVAHNLMPLSPEQIKTLHYLLNRSRQAAAEFPGVPPKATSSTVIVNLSPGSAPPVVRLQQGYVTSLVFVDSTGAPWPIAAYDLGDPSAFNIQWNKKSNTLLVQARAHYQSGNLAVQLKGLDTPVMITLMPGQQVVDYRVDLRVPGTGPNASHVTNSAPSSANPLLLNILDGIPPDGSHQHKVTGGDADVWKLGDHLYIRTRLTVLSPGWIAKMQSADGMQAYEIPETPVILASDQGNIVQLEIQGL